jgi:subtilase family serine protease
MGVYLSADEQWSGSDIHLASDTRTLSPFVQSGGFTLGGLSGGGTIPTNMPPGNYFLIAKYDDNDLVAESDETNNFFVVPITLVSPVGGNNIDLALTLSQANPNPAIYSIYNTTATVTNSGNQTATGVKVKFAKPNGVVYQGSNVFVASQGSFAPYGNQEWNVGNLPPNGSATLTVRYFLLQNGAPVAYAQVSAANETDVDSQPNNGTPPTPNEDDEAVTNSPGAQPDLTISNLAFNSSSITPGQVLSYSFDLANIGNGNAPQNFNVRAWISSNPVFNTNDLQDGIVPTGNFDAGFSVANVQGASFVPNTLLPGPYYLHLWVDADQQVAESNEANNSISAPFTLSSPNGGGNCESFIGSGNITCLTKTSTGLLEIAYENNGEYRKATLDEMGFVANDEPTEPDAGIVRFRINNGLLEKLVDTTVMYSLPIPTGLATQYDAFLNFTEFNGGYILFATKNDVQKVYAVRTDENFVVQQATFIWGVLGVSVTSAIQISDNEFAYTLRWGQMPNTSMSVKVMNSQLEELSSQVFQSGFYVAGEIFKKSCDQFVLTSFFSNFAPKGSFDGYSESTGLFENGAFISDNSSSFSQQLAMGQGSSMRSWSVRLSDGSIITATNSQGIPFYYFPYNPIVRLQKKQGETLVWEKFVKLPAIGTIVSLAMTGDELLFLYERSDSIIVVPFYCVFDPNAKPDLVFSSYVNLFPSPAQAGGDFNANLSINNVDIAEANMFNIKAFLSTDTLFDAATDIVIGSIQNISMAPVSSTSFILTGGSIPANITTGSYYVFLVADADNTVAESNESNNVIRSTLQINVISYDCYNVTIVSDNSELTVAGANAPHVLIKVFNPDWTLLFECLDNCSSPMVLSIYNPGTYHVQVLLMDNNWAQICYLESDIIMYSGSKIAPIDTSKKSLAFTNIFPNPTGYEVNLDLFTLEEQNGHLEIYNAQGKLIERRSVELLSGNNRILLEVYQWPAGFYTMILHTHEKLAYGHFLKEN